MMKEKSELLYCESRQSIVGDSKEEKDQLSLISYQFDKEIQRRGNRKQFEDSLELHF